ncbi:MAG: alpha/beta hydrolase-fold protein [Chloracidobacterium sp.]|nr:alpha/beta hydrolase-fold protein [Chloracidobacterium sp.]MDW8217534.1 alpha/beta hydrolase-fold protein [Acidobacteriota bacterium]
MSQRPTPSQAAFAPSIPKDADSYAGRFQIHPNVASRYLTHKRHVIVYLPPGHGDDPTVRYPVLYMQDGQNLFDGDTAYIRGHDWKMARTAERLMLEKKIAPLIIVGVWNTGVHRIDEYTPTRDSGVKQGGLLPLYGRFIVEELKPFIDATYQTEPGRERTGIGGSSLGGLAALLLGLHYSEYFGCIAALSPSLWWDHGVAFRLVRHLKRKPDVRIWLDMGTREMGAGVMHLRRMRDILLEYGWTLDVDLFYREVRGGKHTEGDWGKRVGTILRRLYPPSGRGTARKSSKRRKAPPPTDRADAKSR